MTPISEVMTRGVRSLQPTDTVVLAAQAMDELNVGFIPVCDGSRLVGVVTDRDIVVRAVAQGCATASTALKDVMTSGVRYVREDEDADEVLRAMADDQIRRLPVIDARQSLVGVVSLGDLAVRQPAAQDAVGRSLADISAPAEPDRRGQSQASGTAGGGQS